MAKQTTAGQVHNTTIFDKVIIPVPSIKVAAADTITMITILNLIVMAHTG